MSDYTINFKKGEQAPMWSYPLSLVEYEAEIEMLKSRIAELEEQLRWKPLSELPDENREVLVKTDRNNIIIIFSHDIEEFNYEEKEHFGYGLIEHFMELPGGEG